MQRQAFERPDGTYYAETQHNGAIAIYGPAPPKGPSPLVLTLEAARPRDRRAAACGVSRPVETGHPALDAVCWVDTRLGDAHVHRLFAGLPVDALVHAVARRGGTLRVRPMWTHLELPGKSNVGRRRVEALVDAVAHLAGAARGLPAELPIVPEDVYARSAMMVYFAGVSGVFGLWWLLEWARLDQAYLGFLGAVASEGAVVALGIGAVAGASMYALIRGLVRRRKRGRTDTHRLASARALAVASWTLPSVAATLVLCNRWLDASASETHVGRVTTHSHSWKNDVVTGLCVEHARGRACAGTRYPEDSNLSREHLDHRATVTLRAGALGWPWVAGFHLEE